MKSLNTYNEADLTNMKFADLCELYNVYAQELGTKQVKKFPDKPTAIARVLSITEDYKSEYADWQKAHQQKAEKGVKKVKAAKRAEWDRGHVVELGSKASDPREGTIEHSLKTAIAAAGGAVKADDLIKTITDTHRRPRSNQPVDDQYVIHNIKWFVKKGTLSIH